MSEKNQHSNIFKGLSLCIIIPTYNNEKTIVQVVDDVKNYCPDIIVVNDGSTDNTDELLEEIKDIVYIGYKKNKGKGYAIRQGFKRALDLGFEYAITIDADGQHFAEDLIVFERMTRLEPEALLIGSRNIAADGMPAKNTFANKFSNFWFYVETGINLPDTQSGFRLYPIKFYKNSKFFTKKYEFEIEVLVRSSWTGIEIISVPVRVDYPEDRVSHFRPLPDFGRISVLNTILVLITFLYIIPRNAFRYLTKNKFAYIVRDQLTAHNESPAKVSAALGFGVFMGLTPIWGFQMLLAAFLAHFMRLNKVLVLMASNISLPPLVPFIIYFSYRIGGAVMKDGKDLSKETLLHLKQQIIDGNFYATLQELGYDILQYIVGSFILAALSGAIVFLVTFLIMKIALMFKQKA